MALGVSKLIKLNVDGKLFQTTLSTLMSSPESLLARMFDPESGFQPPHSEDGVYFLDADPVYFGVILNWLRYRRVMVEPGTDLVSLAHIADYFGIVELVEAAETMENNNKQEMPPLAQWVKEDDVAPNKEVKAMRLSLVTIKGPFARILQASDGKLRVVMSDRPFSISEKYLTLDGDVTCVWVKTVAGKLPPGAIAFEGERGEKLHIGRRLWIAKEDTPSNLQVFLTENGVPVIPKHANISLGYVNEDGVWDINFSQKVTTILNQSLEDIDDAIDNEHSRDAGEIIDIELVCTATHFEVLCTF